MSQVNFTARTEQANEILKNYVIASMGAALVPIPIFDLVALTGIQLKMLHRLSQLYEVEYIAHLGKSLVASLLSGLVLTRAGATLASLAKTFPGLGTATSIIGVSIIGGASSYAIGKVFIQHFESGGTFLTFDPEPVREHFVSEFERGKQVVVELKSTSSPATTTVTSVTPPVKENKDSVAPTSETVAGERETMNASEEKIPVELTPPVVETMAAVEPPAATEVDSSARFDNFSKVVKSIRPASPVAETVATVETSVPIVTESIVPTAAVSMPIESAIIEEVAATVNSTAIITPVVKLTDYQNNRALKPSALAASIRSAIASPAIIDSPVNRFFSPATIAVSESSRTKIWPITAVSEGLVTITEENTPGHNYSASINETVTVPPNNLDTPTEIEVVAAAPSFSTLELSPADQEEIITAITEALITVSPAGMDPENLPKEKSAPVTLSDEEQTEIIETVVEAVMVATATNLAEAKLVPVALSAADKDEIIETVVEAVITTAETKEETIENKPEEKVVSHNLLKFLKNYWFTK